MSEREAAAAAFNERVALRRDAVVPPGVIPRHRIPEGIGRREHAETLFLVDGNGYVANKTDDRGEQAKTEGPERDAYLDRHTRPLVRVGGSIHANGHLTQARPVRQ